MSDSLGPYGLQYARFLYPSLPSGVYSRIHVHWASDLNGSMDHLILCCPFSFCLQSLPESGSFPLSWLFRSSGQSIGASASTVKLSLTKKHSLFLYPSPPRHLRIEFMVVKSLRSESCHQTCKLKTKMPLVAKHDMMWKSFSHVWLCDPMDYTVHRILQARILQWEAFPFSRGSSQPRDWSQVSHLVQLTLY